MNQKQYIKNMCNNGREAMVLSNKEEKVLKQTKLRNLKRKYAKIIQHADLIEEAIEIKADIDQLQKELKLM